MAVIGGLRETVDHAHITAVFKTDSSPQTISLVWPMIGEAAIEARSVIEEPEAIDRLRAATATIEIRKAS